jgi:hypothetical protein
MKQETQVDIVTVLQEWEGVPLVGDFMVRAAKEIVRLRQEQDGLRLALRAVIRVLINEHDHAKQRKAEAKAREARVAKLGTVSLVPKPGGKMAQGAGVRPRAASKARCRYRSAG